MASKKRKSPVRKASPTPKKPAAAIAIMSPCLWFDGQAEEAAQFYVSIFPKAKINGVMRCPPYGQEIHGCPAGAVLAVEFVLNGMLFTALNGGPQFKFNEAVSLQVLCRTQEEIDYYWEKLREGGDPKAQACGWLKDRFGVSWQVAPQGMLKMWKDYKSPGTTRAFAAMMEMKKIDIAALKAAAKGR
jgi:predicted 3-demethylubiquinone-9 3-methyltransferase (glyoxalase superfamily)